MRPDAPENSVSASAAQSPRDYERDSKARLHLRKAPLGTRATSLPASAIRDVDRVTERRSTRLHQRLTQRRMWVHAQSDVLGSSPHL